MKSITVKSVAEKQQKATCWQRPTWTVQSTVPNLTEALMCLEALRNSGSRRMHGGHHYTGHMTVIDQQSIIMQANPSRQLTTPAP